jgi:hypothetical protein
MDRRVFRGLKAPAPSMLKTNPIKGIFAMSNEG